MAADTCDLLCLDLPRAEELRASRARSTSTIAAEFRALGDPTRLAIALVLLEGDELCVCDLAWIMERAQNLVSHHVRALRKEGLVDYRRDGKMALYRLTPRGAALLELVHSGERIEAARG